MPHVTAVAIPQSAPFVQGPNGPIPETQLVLDEVGALYPVVAYWDAEESESSEPPEGEAHMDGETLDEQIFAGMVSSH